MFLFFYCPECARRVALYGTETKYRWFYMILQVNELLLFRYFSRLTCANSCDSVSTLPLSVYLISKCYPDYRWLRWIKFINNIILFATIYSVTSMKEMMFKLNKMASCDECQCYHYIWMAELLFYIICCYCNQSHLLWATHVGLLMVICLLSLYLMRTFSALSLKSYDF